MNAAPMICRDIRSAMRQAIWKDFEKSDVKPSSIIEAGSTAFIKTLVSNNKGISFLAKVCVREEIERGELAVVTLEEGPFFLDIDVIRLKGRTLSPVASAFLHFLRQTSNAENLGSFVDQMRGKGLAV